MSAPTCLCPAQGYFGFPCSNTISQEDMLCDHCRTYVPCMIERGVDVNQINQMLEDRLVQIFDETP